MARITVSQILAFYRGAVAKNSPLLMQEAFRSMEALLTDKNTPEYIKPYMHLTIADAKTAYYIHYANNDSASFYLDKYEEMMKDNPNLYNGFVAKKYKAGCCTTRENIKKAQTCTKGPWGPWTPRVPYW